ncbi:MAG: zinc protease [Acidobacteriota bacterium]|nr:zinc protease [Acidobacteriota bacterium]
MTHPRHLAALGLAAGLLAASPLTASRLAGARVERLPNGLTVMALEDRTLPVVSVQMLYRVGGRTESSGATGLAHFVEHMAFRASERFPDTELASRIYAVGGEWHAYTWIDQTTYFETVPASELDLVLAIEADRMARLLLPTAELEAERGAVLTELHGYENDPASVLNDAVVAASFMEHPYRNNVIGWTSDVEGLTHDEVAAFYHRHYAPANAVLTIAGAVDPDDVLRRVCRVFGDLPGGETAPLPRTVEPPQRGERRVVLHGAGASTFQISYRAPAVTDPDFPAFLLLQAVLAGSPGVNFRQDEAPYPVRPGTRLYGAAPSIATFLAPTAQPYLFNIVGHGPSSVELEIERRIALLRRRAVTVRELERARRDLLAQLDLDEETTEDAAHQMGFFEGAGAFGVLTGLPARLAAISPEDLRRVAASRLQPWQRTIGWFLPAPASRMSEPARKPEPVAKPVSAPPAETAGAPKVKVLANGVALVVRRVPRIPGGHLRVLVPSNTVAAEGAEMTPDEPVWHHTSLGWHFKTGELAATAARARKALADLRNAKPEALSEDPETRLGQTLRGLLSAGPRRLATRTPPVVVAVGDFAEDQALAILESTFRRLARVGTSPTLPLRIRRPEAIVSLPDRAQSQLGYAVPIPGPRDPDFLAWRLLLYVMAHDYEGRLGKELIAWRGLVYFIDARVQADGQAAWISMTLGVNPERLAATRERFQEVMDDLWVHPPTEAEIEEARAHLIGRRLTAPQSDEEMSAFHAREWIEQGRLLSQEEWKQRVRAVDREDVLRIIPRFLAGATAVVDAGPAARHVSCFSNPGGSARHDVPTPGTGGMNMQEGAQQPVTRADIERLTEGHLKVGERKQIVRRLLARAAFNQAPVAPGRFPPPVAEACYDRVLERAFERAWRLHQRLAGREPVEALSTASPGYSLSVPSGRRL